MQKWRILLMFLLVSLTATAQNLKSKAAIDDQQLKPWPKNPHYWQYKGEPILLLAGSKTNHLFSADNLEHHLDEIQSVGGNYVRNTMSQREALDRKPYLRKEDGSFDLNIWNPDYWSHFEKMLKWTYERDIIVQIEVWDRFDYSREFWEISPWNPVLTSTIAPGKPDWRKRIPSIHRPIGSPSSMPFPKCPNMTKNWILSASTKKLS